MYKRIKRYHTENDIQSKNKFLKPYNFKLGSGVNYNKNDKKLYINRTTKCFIAFDGNQLNVSKKLVNNNDVKASKSKNYGLLLYYGYMILSMKSQLHIIQQHQILRKKMTHFKKKE